MDELTCCITSLEEELSSHGPRLPPLEINLHQETIDELDLDLGRTVLAAEGQIDDRGFVYSAFLEVASSNPHFCDKDLDFYAKAKQQERFDRLFRIWFGLDPSQPGGEWHPDAYLGLQAVVALAMKSEDLLSIKYLEHISDNNGFLHGLSSGNSMDRRTSLGDRRSRLSGARSPFLIA